MPMKTKRRDALSQYVKTTCEKRKPCESCRRHGKTIRKLRKEKKDIFRRYSEAEERYFYETAMLKLAIFLNHEAAISENAILVFHPETQEMFFAETFCVVNLGDTKNWNFVLQGFCTVSRMWRELDEERCKFLACKELTVPDELKFW